MFCTVCAAFNRDVAATCGRCGAALAPRALVRRRGRRGRASAIAALVPLLALMLALAGFGGRQWLAEARAEERYDAATELLESGRLVQARAAFARLGDFRDAEHQVTTLDATLNPLRERTRHAGDMLATGQSGAVIVEMREVIRLVPDLHEALNLLEEARLQHRNAAVARADELLTGGDPQAARQTLLDALAVDPSDATLTKRLRDLDAARPALLISGTGGVAVAGFDSDGEPLQVATDRAAWALWSPDRSHFVYIGESEDADRWSVPLWVSRADGSDRRLVATNAFLYGTPVWNPDGRSILYVSAENFDRETGEGSIGLRLVDLETGVIEDLTRTSFSFAASASWSPDGRQFAFASRRVFRRENSPYLDTEGVDIYLYDLPTRQWRNLTTGRIRGAYSTAWSPRGDELLILSETSTWEVTEPNRLFRLHIPTGALTEIDTGGIVSSYPYWSPDGTMFALAQDDRTVRVWSDSGASWVRLPVNISNTLSWAPDGSALLVPPVNPYEPLYLISFGGELGRVEPVTIAYFQAASATGPPQWSARTPAAPAASLPSGTALDS